MNPQVQVAPFTKSVKFLVIANVAIWVVLVLILQGFILKNQAVYDLFALKPSRTILNFWVWQPFTYMFLHSTGVFHVLFNMLTLWWFGSELESRWGTKFFVTYYLVCGVGAGFIYLAGAFIYAFITGNVAILEAPLVGASGATYGLMLAYGLLFGERIMLFMLAFPMKAKYFVLILGIVQLVMLLDTGMGSSEANLAHLGGIGVGFIFLAVVARMRARASGATSRRGRRLKLVVNNERKGPGESDSSGPKYWN